MGILAWLLLGIAVLFIVAALLVRRTTGLPWQRIVYADTHAWQALAQPLLSRSYGLVGKPDYILQRRGRTIPVEVKPSRRASQPYASDMMQLAAYCLLIEDVYGIRPPYGLLRYAHTTFQIRFDRMLRDELLAILKEMQAADPAISANRSHNDQGRCGGCGFVGHCSQALI